MVTLTCRDLGMDCDFVAEANSARKVKGKMFEHARDEHPQMIAGITAERHRQLERAMDEAISRHLAA